jgi:hypothetical protein
MNTEKTTTQRIRLIPLSEMEPESGYQRATNPAQVQSIVRNFDESKLGTLTVSARDGKFHIIDGAHRSRALRELGYSHASCVVLTGLTFEQEAEYFRNQNQDKRLIRPMEFFKAGLISGNEQCVRIYRIAKLNGFNIGTGKKDFYTIEAIQTLFTIIDDYGYEILDDTLSLIAEAWTGILRASQSESLIGVAEFVSRYGTADFAARMKEKFSVIYYEYTEAARTRSSSKSARHKFCRILVEHYNKGLANKSKKRLTWED